VSIYGSRCCAAAGRLNGELEKVATVLLPPAHGHEDTIPYRSGAIPGSHSNPRISHPSSWIIPGQTCPRSGIERATSPLAGNSTCRIPVGWRAVFCEL
jgi:hypothetical protein